MLHRYMLPKESLEFMIRVLKIVKRTQKKNCVGVKKLRKDFVSVQFRFLRFFENFRGRIVDIVKALLYCLSGKKG